MGWATWVGIGVGSSRTKVFASWKILARDRALEGYQPQFDGLRALAVLTVMVDHFSADVPNFPLPDWIRLGATGVRLFLVLSGYFITASLRRARDRMDAGRLSAGRTMTAFYWRRLLRIGPAYLVFAGIALLLNFGAMRYYLPLVFTDIVAWMNSVVHYCSSYISPRRLFGVQAHFY